MSFHFKSKNNSNHIANWVIITSQITGFEPIKLRQAFLPIKLYLIHKYNISNIQHPVQSGFYIMVDPIRYLLTLTTYKSHQ